MNEINEQYQFKSHCEYKKMCMALEEANYWALQKQRIEKEKSEKLKKSWFQKLITGVLKS